MRDGLSRPVRQDHVDRVELIKVIAARFPSLRVVGIAAPVEITHVLQSDSITFDRARGHLCDVIGPDPIVRRHMRLCHQRSKPPNAAAKPSIPSATRSCQSANSMATLKATHKATLRPFSARPPGT